MFFLNRNFCWVLTNYSNQSRSCILATPRLEANVHVTEIYIIIEIYVCRHLVLHAVLPQVHSHRTALLRTLKTVTTSSNRAIPPKNIKRPLHGPWAWTININMRQKLFFFARALHREAYLKLNPIWHANYMRRTTFAGSARAHRKWKIYISYRWNAGMYMRAASRVSAQRYLFVGST